MTDTTCPHCSHTAPPARRWVVGAGVVHLQASCARCGHFFKWLPQTPENTAGLGEKPTTSSPATRPTNQKNLFGTES